MQTHGEGWHLWCCGRREATILQAALYTNDNGWPGARGFRDFSRLPPAQENRGQPADPAPAGFNRALAHEVTKEDIIHGNRFSKKFRFGKFFEVSD